MSSLLIDHPMVTHEQWENFSETDHKTWKILFERQSKLLQNRAANEIIQGMEKLSICSTHIPKISEINAILEKETGFSVIPVKGFIPEDLFFRFLSERKFPATCFIRKAHQLDYLEEPDIFHDVFGHVPLLVNPIFADFMQEFGVKGLEAIEAGMLKFASSLYWFTVEFGLIATDEGVRIYGAGITSSKGESIYALDSTVPARVKFDSQRVMRTKYEIGVFQETYFVVKSFQELFDTLHSLDWNAIGDSCQLTDKICIPCQGGVPSLDFKESSRLLARLGHGWKINEVGHLIKQFKFDDFMKAMAFANKIALVAEKEAHHPDLTLSWGSCSVEIWTHKIKGLTESDFILAAKIEEIIK
jgi:phenylalanine-4-hydroxylase